VHTRTAGPSDAAAVAETLSKAFLHDPVWGVALDPGNGSTAHLHAYWSQYVKGALRYNTVFVGEQARTASVWIPPGGTELSDEEEAETRRLALDALGAELAGALFELWERFEDSHPQDEPHAYLSLLATHPDHAGGGHGQAHLREDLAHWDEVGLPAYLESSNPANNHRYERQGFRAVGEFRTVLDDAVVTTMWRPVGG
jgi:ribosomal protein S18 acetylase RimI-like enzyme